MPLVLRRTDATGLRGFRAVVDPTLCRKALQRMGHPALVKCRNNPMRRFIRATGPRSICADTTEDGDMTKISVDKDDFLEFLHQAADVHSLTFSTNHFRSVWSSDKSGFHHESERRYIKGPCYLLKRSIDEYLKIREFGGRFRIDFHGVYCHDSNRYVIRWIKSADLVSYQTSTPHHLQKGSLFDLYRSNATHEIKLV